MNATKTSLTQQFGIGTRTEIYGHGSLKYEVPRLEPVRRLTFRQWEP